MDAQSHPPSFPTVRWDDLEVTFRAEPLPESAGSPFAAVVFALREGAFVLADIPGRGWITPSGRLEPGETALEAAIRETREEIGACLENPREIGHYALKDPKGKTRYAAAFVGRVGECEPLPEGTESRGVREATLEELPAIYWRWDPLLEAMFRYALSVER